MIFENYDRIVFAGNSGTVFTVPFDYPDGFTCYCS